jgi:hypothetical protein
MPTIFTAAGHFKVAKREAFSSELPINLVSLMVIGDVFFQLKTKAILDAKAEKLMKA